MRKMFTAVKKLFTRDEGATMIEYGLMLALIAAVCLAAVTLLVVIARLGQAYRQLRALAESRREARTDELTGLPNRRHFYETLRDMRGDAKAGHCCSESTAKIVQRPVFHARKFIEGGLAL